MSKEWEALMREGIAHYRRTGTKLTVVGQRWSYGGRTGWHYVLITPFLRQIMRGSR